MRLSFAISNRIAYDVGVRTLQETVRDATGKRFDEVARWLSGEHNFTSSTLVMLSSFFGGPIIIV